MASRERTARVGSGCYAHPRREPSAVSPSIERSERKKADECCCICNGTHVVLEATGGSAALQQRAHTSADTQDHQTVSSIMEGRGGPSWLSKSSFSMQTLELGLFLAGCILRAVFHFIIAATLACAIYLSLYFTFVPEEHIDFPLHFEACGAAPHANVRTALVPLSRAAGHSVAPKVVLPTSGVGYTGHVCFHLPESELNIAKSSFSVQVDILDESNHSHYRSSRTLVLRYKSPLLRFLWTLFYAFPLVMGWMDESQTLCAEMDSGGHLRVRDAPLRRDAAPSCTFWSTEQPAPRLVLYFRGVQHWLPDVALLSDALPLPDAARFALRRGGCA
eukprot:5889763-Pleurochrysis_carterae.AAC.1